MKIITTALYHYINGFIIVTLLRYICILQVIYKENQTAPTVFFKTEPKPVVFLKTEPNLKNPFRTSLLYSSDFTSQCAVAWFNRPQGPPSGV